MDLTSLVTPTIIALLCISAYLLGSVSTAVLVCRAFRKPDPRILGSGNPGASNVLRIAGKPAAVLTFIGDAGKGILPIVLGRYLNIDLMWLGFVGLAAFVGHLFPLFFEFMGGKGVSTAFGVMAILYWPIGLVSVTIWLAVFFFTRVSSIASLSSWIVTPALVYWFQPELFIPVSLLAVVLIVRHQTNMRDIVSGTERRFGD